MTCLGHKCLYSHFEANNAKETPVCFAYCRSRIYRRNVVTPYTSSLLLFLSQQFVSMRKELQGIFLPLSKAPLWLQQSQPLGPGHCDMLFLTGGRVVDKLCQNPVLNPCAEAPVQCWGEQACADKSGPESRSCSVLPPPVHLSIRPSLLPDNYQMLS